MGEMKTCGECAFMPVHRINNPSRLGNCTLHRNPLVGDDYPACADFAVPGTVKGLLRRLEIALVWNRHGRDVANGTNTGSIYNPTHPSPKKLRKPRTPK